jgi:DNA-binding response OmpR family regulator
MPTASARILVVDDEPQILRVLRRGLESHGFEVVTAADAASALQIFRSMAVNLVITDLRMPDTDGVQLCRQIRAGSAVPVIVLSVKGEERTKVEALDAGADDYVTKPFGPRELMARVRTTLRRRAEAPAPSGPVQVGRLVIDTERHVVTLAGAVVDCTPAEFRLLEVLASSPGRVYTRAQLLDRLHGFSRFITERTVDGHVKNLRKKIERDARRPEMLTTVYGVGYKLEPAGEEHAP